MPTGPDAGEKDVMTGGLYQLNVPRDTVADAVTLTFPVLPFPTTAVIELGLLIVKESAGVPPMFTAVTSLRHVPLIFNNVP